MFSLAYCEVCTETVAVLLCGVTVCTMHADSQFLNLGGTHLGSCTECFAAINSRATTVAVNSSTFTSPYTAPGSRYILAFEGERPC